METLGKMREEAQRELDGFVAAVDALADDDWERDSPCVDWKVRDVVEHMIDVVGYSWYAMFLRRVRTGSADRYRVRYVDVKDLPRRSPDVLAEQLRTSATEFRTEVDEFSDEHLSRLEKGERRGLGVFNEFLCEFGIHRADVELGVGHHDFILRPEVVDVTIRLHGSPTDARPVPQENVSYVLIGESVRWEASFTVGEPTDGSEPAPTGSWSDGRVHENCCTVKGSDAAICLVRMGRISTHDDRLESTTSGFAPRFF